MKFANFFKTDDEFEFKDKKNFDRKLAKFIEAYKTSKKLKKKVIVVTDFDYTITKRYDYENGTSYESSYAFYDEDVIGGDQKRIDEIESKLYDVYGKYEFDTTYDLELRKRETFIWYEKSLEVYINRNFTKESLNKMIEKKRKTFEFRKGAKEYLELLIKLDIPVIIVSGGVTQFIEEALKLILPDLEKYLREKKIIIESNNLVFDPVSKGCVGFDRDNIIYCFNKASFLKKIVAENFPNVTNLFILGDHLGDYDSISDLEIEKDGITGFGFLNISPENNKNKRYYNDSIKRDLNEYRNKFDLVMIGDQGYNPFVKLLKSLSIES